MGAEADLEEQVSRRAAADAWAALPGKPDLLALGDTGRDRHPQGSRLRDHVAVGRHFRRTQLDVSRTAPVGVLEVDLDPCDVVLSRRREAAAATPRAGTSSLAEWTAVTEQFREKVAELAHAGAARTAPPAAAAGAAREFEALAPVRRRPEILSLAPVGTELVVSGALLGVFQDLVRFLQFLEFVLGVFFLADVRVVFACEFPVRALDRVLVGIARDSHDLVVVLEAHGPTLAPNPASKVPTRRSG